MAKCKQCDITNPIKAGRATWLCRGCGHDVSIAYVFYVMAAHPLPDDTGSLDGTAGKAKRMKKDGANGG